MLELLILPALMGLGLAYHFSPEEGDVAEEDPVIVDLPPDTLTFDGTDAPDHVEGNALDNLLFGAGGNDLLGGRNGDDTLDGAEGSDRLFGGAGDDTARGGPGDDRIYLGDGDDTATDDDAGNDLIRGGAGNDRIMDGSGSNQIFGDIGHDLIVTVDGLQPDGGAVPSDPGDTADTVHAGYGNDTILGDNGDILTGGEGRDSFVVVTTLNTPGAPVVVTDFDLRDDLFSVVFQDEIPDDPTIRFEFDAAAGLLRAFVGDQDIATLSGLTAADIPFIQTYVTTLPELMAGTA